MDVDRQSQEEGAVVTRLDDVWVMIVWNDPVNLMDYVVYVFQKHFGYSKDQATKHMREVHENGKSVLSSGGRESIEMDVQAMHGYGLWATMQRSDA